MGLTFGTWKHSTESGFFTAKPVLKIKVSENVWIFFECKL